MVVALAVKGKTASLGATAINAFVPLMQFWKEQIEPEILGANGINNAPLLKADALKFLTTFRSICLVYLADRLHQDAHSTRHHNGRAA